MTRPLLISDCDEVLLHMVVPFRDWLDEAHDIHFDLEKGDFVDALRRKDDGTIVKGEAVWPLLKGFFDSEMHRQQPIDGAVEALAELNEIADIVILTNLQDDRQAARTAQLRAVGIDHPVYTNQGGKGEALLRILAEYRPNCALFVDDLAPQHASIAQHAAHVWRLHMIGEPLLASRATQRAQAHARIDRWAEALPWIRERLLSGAPAPEIAEATEAGAMP